MSPAFLGEWTLPGRPLSGSIPGQAGWDCEQPGLEGGVHAYSRALELGDLKGPFQPKLYYDSMVCQGKKKKKTQNKGTSRQQTPSTL